MKNSKAFRIIYIIIITTLCFLLYVNLLLVIMASYPIWIPMIVNTVSFAIFTDHAIHYYTEYKHKKEKINDQIY